jgi:hypothetical protein
MVSSLFPLDFVAVLIDAPLFTWTLNISPTYSPRSDQISIFIAHFHICIEFLELSSGFLEGFCFDYFLALAL